MYQNKNVKANRKGTLTAIQTAGLIIGFALIFVAIAKMF
jgi:hypothetical protein